MGRIYFFCRLLAIAIPRLAPSNLICRCQKVLLCRYFAFSTAKATAAAVPIGTQFCLVPFASK